MFVKLHRSYRVVVAVCDSELIGKTFEDGKKKIIVSEEFYKEDEVNDDQLMNIIKRYIQEDATFNIVGKESVGVAVKIGLVHKDEVGHIGEVPVILIF